MAQNIAAMAQNWLRAKYIGKKVSEQGEPYEISLRAIQVQEATLRVMTYPDSLSCNSMMARVLAGVPLTRKERRRLTKLYR